jgi:hypothetical protein
MAKVVYVCYRKDGVNSVPVGCTNKRLLSRFSGMGYENLVRIFTRGRRFYYEDGERIIMKVYEGSIIRGAQKISRRGRGGSRFVGGIGGY